MLTVAETAALLHTFDNVLILTHVRPDGDTVGCAAALCAGLRALGKTAYLLPNEGLTNNTARYFAPYTAPAEFYPEKVVSVDIAAVGLFPENAQPYINRVDLAVDHHPSFEQFGKANIVRPQAGACGELVYDILAALGSITPEIALPLYVAVATDTGCFVYSNTTSHTHAVAAALMNTGIDYRAVNKAFFRTKSRKRMQLEGAMLSDCEFYDRGRVAILSVPLSLMERLEATGDDTEDLAALGGLIEGVDCSVTMRELQPEIWKISVRTGSRINANHVCAKLGGGGHQAAAGCKVEGAWSAVKQQILESIAENAPDFTEAAR